MSVDVYFDRRYKRSEYNCLAFASEVWKDLTGQDIATPLAELLAGGRVSRAQGQGFVRRDNLTDPCLVLMQRRRATPHVGVYVRGRVLHITESGVEYQPLDVVSRAFTSTRFYQCKP